MQQQQGDVQGVMEEIARFWPASVVSSPSLEHASWTFVAWSSGVRIELRMRAAISLSEPDHSESAMLRSASNISPSLAGAVAVRLNDRVRVDAEAKYSKMAALRAFCTARVATRAASAASATHWTEVGRPFVASSACRRRRTACTGSLSFFSSACANRARASSAFSAASASCSSWVASASRRSLSSFASALATTPICME